MKLQRKYARLALKLLGATIILALLPFLMYNILGAQSWIWMIIGGGGAIGCMTAGMLVRTKHLRCPYCKRGIAIPQWSPGRRRYRCSCCRRPFIYDDETR